MIIGLSGYARSGKDTVAEYLVANYGFTRMAFADPMREALRRLNPLITVGGMKGIALDSAVKGLGWEQLKEDSPEVRGLLQRMGTEVGREMFGKDFWVDYAVSNSEKYDNVVFSDVRFTNEADAIRKNSGENWRINRAGVFAANEHISEHDMDSYPHFEVTLDNAGQLEDLYSQIDTLMKVSV